MLNLLLVKNNNENVREGMTIKNCSFFYVSLQAFAMMIVKTKQSCLGYVLVNLFQFFGS